MPAKLLQSRPTLCNPMDCSLSGSFVYGILQVRILELVAISSSISGVWGDERWLDEGTQVGMKEDAFTKAPRKHFPQECAVCAQLLQSCPTCCDPMDCCLPGSSVHGILRQEYRNSLPWPSPGNLPDPGIKPSSLCLLHWQALYHWHHLGSPMNTKSNLNFISWQH